MRVFQYPLHIIISSVLQCDKYRGKKETYLNRLLPRISMARSQQKAYAKETGKKYHHSRKKKLYELGRDPTFTKIAERKVSPVRVRGGHEKRKLLSSTIANVFNPKTKTYVQASIKTVLENPADRNLVRRNIMTKGTVVDTNIGKARITSRPGQDGIINAVLLS